MRHFPSKSFISENIQTSWKEIDYRKYTANLLSNSFKLKGSVEPAVIKRKEGNNVTEISTAYYLTNREM